jgi:hypothetical protein
MLWNTTTTCPAFPHAAAQVALEIQDGGSLAGNDSSDASLTLS